MRYTELVIQYTPENLQEHKEYIKEFKKGCLITSYYNRSKTKLIILMYEPKYEDNINEILKKIDEKYLLMAILKNIGEY